MILIRLIAIFFVPLIVIFTYFISIMRQIRTALLKQSHFFCHSLINKKSIYNRFMGFNSSQILQMLQDHNRQFTINQKILMNVVLKKFNMQHKLTLSTIQKFIFVQHQLLYGSYLSILQKINFQHILFYLNSFSKLNEIVQEQLIIKDVLGKYTPIDLTQKQILIACSLRNSLKLKKYYSQKKFNLSQLVRFMKHYKNQLNQQFLINYIKQVYQPLLLNEQIILFLYLTKEMNLNYQMAVSFQVSDPEITCLLCEITKDKDDLIRITSRIDWNSWDYKYIVWISEFLDKSILKHAHDRILKTEIEDVNTLIVYIKYCPEQFYSSINNWLCNHDIFGRFQIQDLLNILQYLDKSYFKPFLRLIIKQSLGNFQWSHMTQIYYYALKWEIQHQERQALRIYVVNGYVALGTARSRIPTTSYYYKILQLVTPEQLYTFKINFGYQ